MEDGLEGGKSIHGVSLRTAVAVIQTRVDDSLPRVNGSGHGETGRSERSLGERVHGNG